MLRGPFGIGRSGLGELVELFEGGLLSSPAARKLDEDIEHGAVLEVFAVCAREELRIRDADSRPVRVEQVVGEERHKAILEFDLGLGLAWVRFRARRFRERVGKLRDFLA